MSAPSAGSPNGSPVPGYYPDPSIPGYIRYWNGSSWTPGTSRPAPGPGEPAPAPPAEGGLPATRAGEAAAEEPESEEDDRDEIDLGRAQSASRRGGESLPEVRRRAELAAAPDPEAGQEYTDWDDPRRLHGGAPDPGTAWQPDPGTAWQADGGNAWQADPAQQSGPGGGPQDLAWGLPAAGPALPSPGTGTSGVGGQDPRAGWGTPAVEPPAAEPPAHPQAAPPDHTVGIRMPRRRPGASGHSPHGEGVEQPPAPDHTVGIRMPPPGSPDAGQGAYGTPGAHDAPGAYGPYGAQGESGAYPEPTVGLRRSDVLAQGGPAADPARQGGQPPAGHQQPPAEHDPYGGPGHAAAPQGAAPAGQDAAAPPAWAAQQVPQARQAQHQAQQGAGQVPAKTPAGGRQHIPGHPHPGPSGAPGAPGMPGAGPWRPPADDPFADAAQDARPAGLGKRFVARLLDGLVVNAVIGAVAFPFVGKWVEHIQDKIEATNQAGVTRTIWLVDGTTGVYLAVILGAFLLLGLLYEALPTAKWGRTLGKKLLGIQVLDLERQDTPGFGAALRRWLTYNVLALVAIGLLNVIWCLFDRPWRQCWHDKVARTFVAGR